MLCLLINEKIDIIVMKTNWKKEQEQFHQPILHLDDGYLLLALDHPHAHGGLGYVSEGRLALEMLKQLVAPLVGEVVVLHPHGTLGHAHLLGHGPEEVVSLPVSVDDVVLEKTCEERLRLCSAGMWRLEVATSLP